MPPLRERLEDVEVLVRHWLPKASALTGSHVTGISAAALASLRSHSWPGNVRELRHVLERATFAASGSVLTASDVRAALGQVAPAAESSNGQRMPSRATLSLDDQRSLTALEQHRWNRAAAARSLGINRSTLWRALRRLDVK